MRNPPGTLHSPVISSGYTIFVKLGQLQSGDHKPVVVNTGLADFSELPERRGVRATPLHRYRKEYDDLEYSATYHTISVHNTGGIEVVVLEGQFA